MKIPESKNTSNTFFLFNKYTITFSQSDWAFMCQYRWFSNNPSIEELEAEFGLSGLRNAKGDEEANDIVHNTVDALRNISRIDVCQQCEVHLNSNINTVAKMDENGKIYLCEG